MGQQVRQQLIIDRARSRPWRRDLGDAVGSAANGMLIDCRAGGKALRHPGAEPAVEVPPSLEDNDALLAPQGIGGCDLWSVGQCDLRSVLDAIATARDLARLAIRTQAMRFARLTELEASEEMARVRAAATPSGTKARRAR